MTDEKEVYTKIATRIATGILAGGSRFAVAIVPKGTPLATPRRKLLENLRTQGVNIEAIAADPHGDLAETASTMKARPDLHGLLVYGLEQVTEHERETYLRRSNFKRGRLARNNASLVLVMEQDAWRWLATNLPDLARWADGPFVLPEVDSPPHPLARIWELSPRLGGPLTPEIDIELDQERGGISMEEFEDGIFRGAPIKLLAGAAGSGRTHVLVRLQQHLVARGHAVEWPPCDLNIDGRPFVGTLQHATGPDVPFPKNFGDVQTIDAWLDTISDKFVFLGKFWARGSVARLAQRGLRGLVVASASSAFGPMTAANVERYYLPPVVIERGGRPHDPGLVLLERMLRARIQCLGYKLDDVIAPAAVRRLAELSGGLPGQMIWLAALASHKASELSRMIDVATVDLVAADQCSRLAGRYLEATSTPPPKNVPTTSSGTPFPKSFLLNNGWTLAHSINGELVFSANPLFRHLSSGGTTP